MNGTVLLMSQRQMAAMLVFHMANGCDRVQWQAFVNMLMNLQVP